VSFREYARKCDTNESAVRRYAKAWELRISDAHVSISDALVKADTSEERYDVIESIAAARAVSPKATQPHHGDEVRRIRFLAQERAESRGTSVREEADRLAEMA